MGCQMRREATNNAKIMIVLDGKTGQLRKSPDIISRGFVYLKLRESQELLRQTRILIKRTVETTTGRSIDPNSLDDLKNDRCRKTDNEQEHRPCCQFAHPHRSQP